MCVSVCENKKYLCNKNVKTANLIRSAVLWLHAVQSSGLQRIRKFYTKVDRELYSTIHVNTY